ncbi:histidinol-phosphate transaminase [Isoptericola sp. b441]|uniref:Aromatic amino acid aminotransferase n=1 Tax=Actinotalea lenta TaxID=3064654 RepID=A0ABT9DAM8_9CELL|nr:MULTISPECIES: histidinol-phosphate transaminase [unclassified Isoptericola]MDO8106243.1 histidinol-phosphate transaminase [Isoptericola sp. b441]MDO8122037.1 histidinol-phosphate transaminase [Isoptericola sp. b490]
MTQPRPRPAVASLPAYVPGARPSDERAHKLSSNENPYPPLDPVRAVIAEAAGRVNRYPEMFADTLVAALGERFGVGPAGVVASTGSVAVLSHLLQAYCEPGDQVVTAWRSFEAYPILVRLQGAEHVQVPLASGARHDLAAMADAVTDRTRAVLVCTPNNPTGPAVHHDELVALLASVPEDVVVVIDEAYVEFITDPRAADGPALLAEHPNVVLLRTFSKAYGLAGLRVGYAVAHPEVAAAVRTAATPFGVNDLAQTAAVASLTAEDALLDRVRAVVAERERVAGALRGQGWQVPDAQGNFVWLPTGDRTAELASRAAARGLLVRPFAGEGVRVSIGSPDANDAVLALTAEWAPGE